MTIVYRHPSLMVHPDLAGWEPRPVDDSGYPSSPVAVCHRLYDDRNHCAICDPYLWDPAAATGWTALENGWEVGWLDRAMIPGRDLTHLAPWCRRVLAVENARGLPWLAPVILTPEGLRGYPVAYAGKDFLPAPTPAQAGAEAIAKEFRERRLAAASGGDGIPVSVACRWAAALLAITHHVSAEAIAALGLLDDVLVDRTLSVAAGLDERLTHARPA